ncbi:MAG TPA: AMP-binding protein [Burkholderiaceae bacterium]|nr:AMP-binding protein [Burkholderiaceae bacterium]
MHAAGGDHYDALYREFRWQVPEAFNIAEVCCERWARDPQHRHRIALIEEAAGGSPRMYSFAQLADAAQRLSAALAALGVARGDRVAIVLPQRFETAAAHMAIYRLGAVAMPLSTLFGPEALEFRLKDSQACAAILDDSALSALLQLQPRCPGLKHLIGVDTPGLSNVLQWDALLERASRPGPTPVATAARDPAVLIYTSGTTGNPKGALIPHCALIGNLTGFVASQNWFPQDGDVFWSPADWAWTGGLMDALLPALYFGAPIVGYRGRFSAQVAFELMQRHGVTNTFLFPTALKMMMKAYPVPSQRFKLKLRAIMSAGEAVGETVFAWCQSALGVRVNEMFGQTEVNYIVGNSDRWPARAGSMGRPYPGHRVEVIDDNDRPCADGEIGEIAVATHDIHGDPDPVFFLGYWNNERATRAKFTGAGALKWCRTGDLASRDAEGYLWYQGRADDVFKAAGYRIGPGEIENCLLQHPSVANAAVVPKPDAERGALVKAFVVLTDGARPSAELAMELQKLVRGRLAPYEYPKEIEFIAQLPMTTTGKVQRRVLRDLEAERARKEAQQLAQAAAAEQRAGKTA